MLKDRKNFVMLFKEKNISNILTKIATKLNLGFNIVKSDDIAYVIYPQKETEKKYISDIARSKRIKLIWKDEHDFYIIDFRNNSKGDIVAYLSNEDVGAVKIQGDIMKPNVKTEFLKCSKIPLVSSKLLDDENPYNYEGFCFYIKQK